MVIFDILEVLDEFMVDDDFFEWCNVLMYVLGVVWRFWLDIFKRFEVYFFGVSVIYDKLI